MAKTKRRHQQQKQQQLLVIYLTTTCLVVVSLLLKADSVSGSNIPVDGSGNILLQPQPQHQHVIDNTGQESNFIKDPLKPTIAEEENEEATLLNAVDLLKNQPAVGQQFKPVALVKRAPGGFLGMRGKKMFEENDNEEANESDINFNLPWQQLPNTDEVVNWNDYATPDVRRYKKAPNAFYGVRGKKFVNMNGVNANSDNNNRWHEFLQKLEEERVRDALLQDFVERLAGTTKNDITSDLTKRAPIGFTGVRGKRLYLNELDSSMENFSKRGLGNNAFIGVRGKKDVSHQAVKRSPAGGPESSPGRNGKRQRFVDFNNKFVAVRGKKSSSYSDMSAALNAIRVSGAAMNAASLSSWDKRAPKGFLGMRGKRPFATDDV